MATCAPLHVHQKENPACWGWEIRDAYKRLMSQYHPDHVAHLGQELRDLAQQKSKEISAAYVQAMQGRAELP